MTFVFSAITRMSFGKQDFASSEKDRVADFNKVKLANAGLKAKFREDLNDLLESDTAFTARAARVRPAAPAPLRLVASR